MTQITFEFVQCRIGVRAYVYAKVRLVRICLPTKFAHMWLLTCVYACVLVIAAAAEGARPNLYERVIRNYLASSYDKFYN